MAERNAADPPPRNAMDPVYLDHAATTPLRAEVREAMAPCLGPVFGNPSSTHRWGRAASAALEDARDAAASALGVDAGEVRFVRGGTESDNLAVLGRVAAARAAGASPRVVHSAVEHRAVLEAAAAAARPGGPPPLALGVEADGTLDLDALDAALEGPEATRPAVVSVMAVNNEVGLRLPVDEVVRRCRPRGVPVHSDAVQAVGKTPLPRGDDLPDLLTVTGHKIHGPKGTGILVVRRGTAVEPLFHGGGQERRLRPGTEDVAGAVGMAAALRLAVAERDEVAPRLAALRDRLEAALAARVEGIRVHGGDAPRAPHISHVGVPGVDTAALLVSLDLEGVAVSAGSACSSGATAASHVLRALYGEGADGRGVVRFSLGRDTTEDEVDRAAEALGRIVHRMADRAS